MHHISKNWEGIFDFQYKVAIGQCDDGQVWSNLSMFDPIGTILSNFDKFDPFCTILIQNEQVW